MTPGALYPPRARERLREVPLTVWAVLAAALVAVPVSDHLQGRFAADTVIFAALLAVVAVLVTWRTGRWEWWEITFAALVLAAVVYALAAVAGAAQWSILVHEVGAWALITPALVGVRKIELLYP